MRDICKLLLSMSVPWHKGLNISIGEGHVMNAVTVTLNKSECSTSIARRELLAYQPIAMRQNTSDHHLRQSIASTAS